MSPEIKDGTRSVKQKAAIAGLFFLGFTPFVLNGFYNPLVADRPAWFWLSDLGCFVLLPVATLVVGLKLELFGFYDLGFHFDIMGKKKADPFFYGFILLPVALYFTYEFANRYALYHWGWLCWDQKFSYSQVMPKARALRMASIFYMSLTAGLAEEYYFRGMLRLVFGDKVLGRIFFVLVSSALFSLIHWEGGVCQLFSAFAFGLVIGAAYLYIRNIWPLVFSHFVLDLVWIG